MTEQNLPALANQGDPKVIVALLNQLLQSKGIVAKATLKNDCLQIILEAGKALNQEKSVAFIRKAISRWQLESIDRVKVYGRQTGEDFPDWEQEFQLEKQVDLPASSVLETSVEDRSLTPSAETEENKESAQSTIDHQPAMPTELVKPEKPSFWGSMLGTVAGAAGAIGSVASQAGGAVAGAAVGAAEAIGSAASQAGGVVAGATVGARGAIGSAATQAGGAVAGATVGAAGVVSSALKAGGAVAEAAVGARGAIGSTALQATQIVGKAIEIVGKNPQLQQAIKSLNKDWLLSLIDQVDVVQAETAVRQIQKEYPDKKPRQIAHRLMLEKALYAGGMGLASSLLPGAAAAMFAVDWGATAVLSAELVYQIAAAFSLDLKDSERKAEVIAIFGLAFGGSQAIKAGLGLLRNVPVAGAAIGASSNAVMIYALGYAACRFYEAKQNPLILEATLEDVRTESEKYLEAAISQEKIMDQILVHIVLAGNAEKSWENILPELQAANLSPASLEAIESQIESPPPLETLLSQLSRDFAVPVLVQCQKIAELDDVITPEEAMVIETITNKFNIDLDAIKEQLTSQG